MAKTYQAPRFMGLGNAIVSTLLRLGVPMGSMMLLTVTGRKSGVPRTTPVYIVQEGGGRWLISPYGEVNWVRNLRTAGQATLTRGRRQEQIAAQELPPAEAAPVLKTALAHAPSFLHAYFDAGPADPISAFEQDALHHPVFQLTAAGPAGAHAGL